MRILLALLISTSGLFAQTAAVPLPNPEVQWLDQNGKPLSGAKVCTYAAGTSTPLATYTDSTATTPNTNPVILDVYGRASIWVRQVGYKIVLRTGGDGTCSTGTIQWSQDSIYAIFKQVDTINGLTGTVTLAGTANQVIITPSGNTLTFTLPQAIATTSSPHFANLGIDGLLAVGATTGSIAVNGFTFISAARDVNADSYSINGDGIVDSSKNATLHAVTVTGQVDPAIDNVANFSGHSLTIDGTLAINNTRDATLRNITITGTCVGCPAISSQAVGGHALNTTYQNTGLMPKFVNVDVNLSASSSINIYSDGLPAPTTIVGGAGTPGTVALLRQTVSFWILPNAFYKVSSSGTVTINNWAEWSQ